MVYIINKIIKRNRIAGIISILIGLLFLFLVLTASADIGLIARIVIVLFLILPWIFFGIAFLINARMLSQNLSRRQSAPVVINTKFKKVVDAIDDGDSHYFIETSWVNPDDNKLYFFKSEEVTSRVSEIIEKNNITEIPVIYEAGNINNYEVDLSRLGEDL